MQQPEANCYVLCIPKCVTCPILWRQWGCDVWRPLLPLILPDMPHLRLDIREMFQHSQEQRYLCSQEQRQEHPKREEEEQLQQPPVKLYELCLYVLRIPVILIQYIENFKEQLQEPMVRLYVLRIPTCLTCPIMFRRWEDDVWRQPFNLRIPGRPRIRASTIDIRGMFRPHTEQHREVQVIPQCRAGHNETIKVTVFF